jgi:hypothetical protein
MPSPLPYPYPYVYANGIMVYVDTIQQLFIGQLNELAAEVDRVRRSPSAVRRMAIESTLVIFHTKFNQFLLGAQAKRRLFFVAGRNTWESRMGMKIMDGSRPLLIFIPKAYKPVRDPAKPVRETPIELYKLDNNEEKNFLFFSLGYVYPNDQIVNYHSPEALKYFSNTKYPEQESALITFCGRKGVTISYSDDSVLGESQGLSFPDQRIVIRESTGTQLIVHELAHNFLGHTSTRVSISKQMKEYEAEITTYLVGNHFGWDMSSSINYLVLWRATGSSILEINTEIISQVASEIIEGILAELDSPVTEDSKLS